jgi:putative protein kinase ArgK-like GTPase of G3E family
MKAEQLDVPMMNTAGSGSEEVHTIVGADGTIEILDTGSGDENENTRKDPMDIDLKDGFEGESVFYSSFMDY